MATLGEISTAINQIKTKKEKLRKSFLFLQSQSPSSLNSTLNWTDIDSYFTTLSSSLSHKFHLLKTLNPPSTTVSQLHSFCHNSDASGLRTFIIDSHNRNLILSHLPDAYRSAPDAAAMVLDAIEGFCCSGSKGLESRLFKSGCLIMLEALIRVMPDVRVELRDKAMKLAVEWNLERVNSHRKERNVYAFGFLYLVEAYGLIDGFSVDEFIDCFVDVAKRRQAIDLCRRMIPANKMNDLIQELINKNMQVAAVKFIIKFQKTDQFSPVDLLEERKLTSMRILENIPKKGKKHENAVILKELTILKSIIRCIDEHHLESDYPKNDVVALVKKLENEMSCKKRPAKAQQQQQPKPKKAKVNKFLEAAVENSEKPD
ncbi:hypothetical protein L6452_00280 [Arctium lappa]|uniref:Uncharacterized protein n=1 Tax=Arctium lappa TaxID=4217 RepID=A0ACB9FE98_ARCLA|nr:hypothetical protein L6452_00280 [Arctium lappa]